MLDLVITRSGKPWARSSQNTELHGQVASSAGTGLGGEGLGTEILGKVIGPERCLR